MVFRAATWAAMGALFSGKDAANAAGPYLVILAIVFACYAFFVIREVALDALGELWSLLLRLHGRQASGDLPERSPIVPSTRSPRSCPRCGARIPMGYAECDVCIQLGIPPAPVVAPWTRPVESDDVEYATESASWIHREKTRDFEKERALMRARIALLLMVGTSFAGLMGGMLLRPPAYDAPLLVLSAFTLMAADFVRRFWMVAVPLGAVLTAATLIMLLADLGIPPIGLALPGLASGAAVIQAWSALGMLKEKRDEAQAKQAA